MKKELDILDRPGTIARACRLSDYVRRRECLVTFLMCLQLYMQRKERQRRHAKWKS